VPVLIAGFLATGCSDPDAPLVQGVEVGPNGDVFAAGRSLMVSDSVPGDVMLAGWTLHFDGFTGGSYVGAGADLTVTGEVRGSVRATGGTIELDATVGRNVTLAGGTVIVAEGTRIEGNAYLTGGEVRFSGTTSGDVYASGGDVLIDGDIGGNLRIDAENVTIGPDATIRGQLRYRTADNVQPTVPSNAVVEGGVEALEPSVGTGGLVMSFLRRVLTFVLTASVVVALLPRSLVATADALESRPAAAFGRGLLWLFITPVAVILCAVTVVGLPLALILGGVYGASFYLAPIIPAVLVGHHLSSRPEPGDWRSAPLPAMIGATVVALVMLLPWVGFLARLAAMCAGVGGIALVIQTRRTTEPA